MSEQSPLRIDGNLIAQARPLENLDKPCPMSELNKLKPLSNCSEARGSDDSNLPLARSATSGSRAASIAASIAARSRLSCVRVSTSCRAVAGVAAIRRLGLRIGLQHRSGDHNLCLTLAQSCM